MNFNCRICGEKLYDKYYIDERKFIGCALICSPFPYDTRIGYIDDIIVEYVFPIKYNNNYYLLASDKECGTSFEIAEIYKDGKYKDGNIEYSQIYESNLYIPISCNEDVNYLIDRFLKLRNL